MSDIQPFNSSGGLSRIQRAKADQNSREARLDVFKNGLAAAAQTAKDGQDTLAVADATFAALNAELDLLEWGMHRAGNSVAKAELVARKVSLLAALNDQRITRRFGR